MTYMHTHKNQIEMLFTSLPFMTTVNYIIVSAANKMLTSAQTVMQM